MQFFKKKKRESEEDPQSKGLVKWGDEWITPAEKFRREQMAATSTPIVREKETIVSKEIVKVRCQYCGTLYNIAEHDRCPHCGGK